MFAIDRFMDGVDLLQKEGLNKSSICRVNCSLRNIVEDSHYRNMDIWIGRNKKKAKHIPPSHSELDSLMSDWLCRANQEKLTTKEIFEIYAQYLLIHPFPDGNGRTGRAIIMALFKKHGISCLAPDLYRLKTVESSSFIEQVQSCKTDTQITTFIEEWLSWENLYRLQVKEQLKRTNDLIESKLILSPLNEIQAKVLNLLWDQAVISKAYVKKKLNTDDKATTQALAFLINRKILEEKRVKTNLNVPIYQAPIILNFLQKLDDLIFTT